MSFIFSDLGSPVTFSLFSLQRFCLYLGGLGMLGGDHCLRPQPSLPIRMHVVDNTFPIFILPIYALSEFYFRFVYWCESSL